jgi:TatD DNase family protein
MLVDAHAHLDLEHYSQDQAETVRRAKEAGLGCIINVGIESERWQSSLELAKRYPGFIYLSLGLHPNDILREADPDLALLYLEKLIADNPGLIVAVGETGLDYYHDDVPPDVQEQYFIKQIELARKLDMPLVIHCRDAMTDTIEILRKHAHNMPVMMHCFSGTLPEALSCIELGPQVYISLAGPLTFKNASDKHIIAREVPLERLLVETDCPFLTPHPYRGKRNEPSYVKFVAEKIAELKAISYDEVTQVTGQNVRSLFRLK